MNNTILTDNKEIETLRRASRFLSAKWVVVPHLE